MGKHAANASFWAKLRPTRSAVTVGEHSLASTSSTLHRRSALAGAAAAVALGATFTGSVAIAPEASAHPGYMQTWHYGDKGPSIRDLQRKLGVTADGIFGPRTKAAVVTVQRRAGLVPDGVVGPKTRTVLGIGTARPAPAPAPSATNKGDRVVAFARAQIGKRYVWGATGPSTYDCSGLTGAAYRAAGISIPRTSSQQRAAGRVTTSPVPGDLVWWPGHIGIYVGGGRMIDASNPRRPVGERAVWRGATYLKIG